MEHSFVQITRTEHLPTRIATQLAERIHSGALAAGEKLPAELMLSKTFGVSRTVMREAIAQLRNEGLVETRQGVGAFVLDRQSRHIRLDDADKMGPEAFRHLYQLRVPLELEAASLAAVHRTQAHLDALEASMDRMAQPEDWTNGGVSGDIDFHRLIAEATGNDYFAQFVSAIAERIRHVILAGRVTRELDSLIAVTLQEHRAILDAIHAQDPLAARAAMRTHMMGSAERTGLPLTTFSY